MALPWPHGLPTLPRPTLPRPASAVRPTVRPVPVPATSRSHSSLAARLRTLAVAPVTTLVAMLVGLALLFAVPLVGLPFVGLVVLPAVVFHLRAERRTQLRARR